MKKNWRKKLNKKFWLNNRGVCGWSMGGHGTIKMGMLCSEVFSCAYAISPVMLTLHGNFGARGDSLVTHYDVLKKWYNQLPLDMIDSYVESFSKLKAFKVDWGKYDNFPMIPITSRIFSEKLEALGIEHYAEEFIGGHGNKLWSPDGRMINNVLPFFDSNLEFQEL